MLVVFIGALQFHFPAEAANQPDVAATYRDGVVNANGSGFSANVNYTVRVVDQSDSSIKAMSQATADGSGNLSASVTTGALERPGNYIVYINRPDGTLAGSGPVNENMAAIYTATIKAGSGGRIIAGTSGSYAPGTVIHIEASADNGYIFNGWTVTGGGTLANAQNASTIFTMPAADVTITAQFVYRAASTPLAPTPTPSVEISTATDGDTTVVSTAVTAKKDMDAGTVQIGADTVASMVNRAQEAEASGQKAVLEFKVILTEDVAAVSVEFPGSSFKRITDHTNASVKVDAGIGTIIFDTTAVAAINRSAGAEAITISIGRVENAAFTEEARSKIGDRPVYDFSVQSGDAQISDFDGGKAEIIIPYTPKDGEKEHSIVVYYIDNMGQLVPVRGKYDSSSKMIRFTASHFSQYAVGYNEVNFKDVSANAWYEEAIGFMSARGILNGVGGGRFKPETHVTRADFLIMVMNSYGIELEKSATDNFSDSGNTYYTRYLGTAKHLGLISGVGGNRYAPEMSISREDMFVILYNVLKRINELPPDTSGKSFESYRDADDIANYAKDVLKLFVANDIIKGNGDRLTPKASSTRAEAAQILFNLLSK